MNPLAAPGRKLRRGLPRRAVAVVALVWLALCCGGGAGGGPAAPAAPEVCDGFARWQDSDYVLPYPVGRSYFLSQANCSGFGHSGFWRYGYDFTMPIATLITAARDGLVLLALEGTRDGDRRSTNLVTIEHADGTVALYSHLTFNGALVERGDVVRAGDAVGLSGDSGNTGGVPHLHFSLHPCESLPDLPVSGTELCPTIPVTFRNTEPNPRGLSAGRSYLALPFD